MIQDKQQQPSEGLNSDINKFQLNSDILSGNAVNLISNNIFPYENFPRNKPSINYIFTYMPNNQNQIWYTSMNYYNYCNFNNFLKPYFFMPNQDFAHPYPFYIMNSNYSLIELNPLLINNPNPQYLVPSKTNQILNTIDKNGEEELIKNTPILLNKKRKVGRQLNLKNGCIINKINKNTRKGPFFIVKLKIRKNALKEEEVKKMFIIYKKSKYVYFKRKMKKKFSNLNKSRNICDHKGCCANIKTKKQFIFHHFKKTSECHNDTISLLKMISSVKKLLLKENQNQSEIKKNEIIEKYSHLYEEVMKNISLDEYIDSIAGFNLQD